MTKPRTPTELVRDSVAGDAKAVLRLARSGHPRVAPMLADVALRTTSQLVVGRAVAALIRRKTDAKAIAGLARFLREAPVEDPYEVGLELAAIALAESKHPRAVAAAIAAYPAIERGSRPGFFLIQTLSNRVERDRGLRANRALVDLLVEVAGTNDEENADAIHALANARDPRTVRALIALLRHRDAYVRQTAALALIRIRRADGLAAARAFIKRCKDPETVEMLEGELKKKR